METKLKNGIHRFAISGTPGIGKSVFLFYLMWLLSKKKDSVNVVILQRSQDNGKIFVFKKELCFLTRDLSDIDSFLNDRSTWYLTDALSPPPAEVRAVTVLVASPSKHLYKSFLKYAPAIELNYLPIWSLEELYQCSTDLFPGTVKSSIEERYDLIGGVPRFVLESPQNLERRIATGVGKLVIEKFNQIVDGSLQREDEVCHFIIHFVVEQDLETFSLQFASLYVTEKAFDSFNVHNHKSLLLFLAVEDQPTLSSLRGQLFELHAHRQLYSGGTFCVRPLTSDSPAKTDVTFSKLDVKRFKKISECSKENTYYIPISKRFSCIDSVIPNIGFFQMTVSDRHPINMKEMGKLLTAIDIPFNTDIYFVVPNNIYPEFRAQKFLTQEGHSAKKLKTSIQNLKQYALNIDIPQ